MSLLDDMRTAISELSAVTEGISEPEVDRAAQMICDARRIVLYGCGREGLQLQGFAMRLHHLGLSVSMVGDMSTPPLAKGDLFIASAGPGKLSTVTALIGQAKKGGASVLFLTADPDSETAQVADQTLVIPAQTMADDQTTPASTLPMGSLYEGAMFLLFEAMVLSLVPKLGESSESIRARHTNME